MLKVKVKVIGNTCEIISGMEKKPEDPTAQTVVSKLALVSF